MKVKVSKVTLLWSENGAKRRRVEFGEYAFDLGPDHRHKLSPSLTVLYNGRRLACLWDDESVGMASALLVDELLPGVLLDWLKDKGYVR